MIDTAKLVRTALETAKQGTSGYFTEQNINDALYDIGHDILKLYGSLYERTRIISDDVMHLVTPYQMTALGTLPSNYFMFVRGRNSTTNTSIYPLMVNEVDGNEDNMVRRSSKSGQSYYYMEGGMVKFKTPSPNNIINVWYIRTPVPGSVSYSYSEEDEDYVTISTSSPLDWPESVFNLFKYKLLDRIGIESKDQLQMEYARLGITEEVVKLNQ